MNEREEPTAKARNNYRIHLFGGLTWFFAGGCFALNREDLVIYKIIGIAGLILGAAFIYVGVRGLRRHPR